METHDEAELLRGARAGDAHAFARLCTPHLPTLLAYSRAICGDFHAAQDVVQETVLIAFKNLAHLFPEVDFGVWLRAIARRQALAARRKLNRVPLLSEQILENVYADPEPADDGLYHEKLAACLESLSGRMKSVIAGHYFDGSSLQEMARQMDITTNAAKQLLYRARLWLRECVEKRLGVDGDA